MFLQKKCLSNFCENDGNFEKKYTNVGIPKLINDKFVKDTYVILTRLIVSVLTSNDSSVFVCRSLRPDASP